MKQILISMLLFSLSLAYGCGDRHAREVQSGLQGERVTVGTVQKSIKIGMPASDVAVLLGSPNVVTTDEERREVWIYDKFATDVATSGGQWTILFAGGGAGAASKSQRTLTIIIKFDKKNMVRDFAYHTSRF